MPAHRGAFVAAKCPAGAGGGDGVLESASWPSRAEY